MAKRVLGNSGLSISPLVFGGNVFGWTADKAQSFALLDRFLDAGFETIDTADVYSSWPFRGLDRARRRGLAAPAPD